MSQAELIETTLRFPLYLYEGEVRSNAHLSIAIRVLLTIEF